jgi:hypothetical protein
MTDRDLSPLQRSSKPLSRISSESERGPPAGQGYGSVTSGHADNQGVASMELLQKQVEEKTAEIHSLQKELMMSTGKIKGYQTLSHLFQEAKQECSRYKHKNNQLSLQLDIMMKRFPTDELQNENSADVQQINDGDHLSVGESLASGLTTIREGTSKHADSLGASNALEMSHDSSKSVDQYSEKCEKKSPNSSDWNIGDASFSLSPSKETVNRTGQEKTEFEQSGEGDGKITEQLGERSRNHSPTSTNSFVQISNPETEHSDREDLEVEQQSNPHNQRISKLGDCTLMEEIHQITEYISNPLISGVGDSHAMTADLLRLGVKAMKMEKQSRVKQVLIDNLSTENMKLKEQVNSLEKALQQKNKQLEERDEQEKQNRKTSLQDMVLTSSESSETMSLDWVKVQQNMKTSEMKNEEVRNKNKESTSTASSVSSPEKDCRIELQFLHMKTEEQQVLIKHWQDKHRALAEDAKSQISSLEIDKNRLLRQLEMITKKGIEDEARFNAELEKKTLQIQEERRRRHEEEESHVALKTKKNQLENELDLLKSRQLEAMDLQYCLRSSETSPTDQPSLTETELRNQMLMLRQQVTVFKEDFDQERRDREKAKAEADEHRKEIIDLKTELTRTKEQLRASNTKNQHLENENRSLKSHFEKVSNDFKQLVAVKSPLHEPQYYHHGQPSEMQRAGMYVPYRSEQGMTSARSTAAEVVMGQTHARHAQPAGQSNTEMKDRKWPCRMCTYLNPARATKCQICLSEKPDLSAVMANTNRAGVMGGPNLFQCDSLEQELTGRGGGPGGTRLSNSSDDITMDRSSRN